MNGFTLLTMLAGLGTVASYTSGIRSMIYRGSWSSTRVWRVVFLGAALVTVLAALLSRML